MKDNSVPDTITTCWFDKDHQDLYLDCLRLEITEKARYNQAESDRHFEHLIQKDRKSYMLMHINHNLSNAVNVAQLVLIVALLYRFL